MPAKSIINLIVTVNLEFYFFLEVKMSDYVNQEENKTGPTLAWVLETNLLGVFCRCRCRLFFTDL